MQGKGNYRRRFWQFVAGLTAIPVVLIGFAGMASAAPASKSKPVPAAVQHFAATHVGCSISQDSGSFTVTCEKSLVSYTHGGGSYDLVEVRFSATGAVIWSFELLHVVGVAPAPTCTYETVNNKLVYKTNNRLC